MTQTELRDLLTPSPNLLWFAVSSEKEPDLLTKAIQKFQGTKYSHALAIYWSHDTEDYVIANARGQASQLDNMDQFHEIDQVDMIWELDVTATQRRAFMKEVVRLDGIDYSEAQILNIGIEFIFGLNTHNNNGIDGIICSEYADRLAVAPGLNSTVHYVDKTLELINPKHNTIAWDAQVVTNPALTRLK